MHSFIYRQINDNPYDDFDADGQPGPQGTQPYTQQGPPPQADQRGRRR